MATLKEPLEDDVVKKMSVVNLRKEYIDLANRYTKITNGEQMYCHGCHSFLRQDTFYLDDRFESKKFPLCKRCVMKIVEQTKNKNDTPNETKESVQKVLQAMDLPYIDSFYEDCVKGANDGVKEKNRTSPFATYITSVKSLPNWKGMKWANSEFGSDLPVEQTMNRQARKEIRKIFGSGFSNEDYLYLQDQYDDWKSRTQVDSKSQETYIIRICFKLLDLWKAQKQGKDTSSLDKSLNELMGAANLQPKQNVGNAATDSLTFSQLIEKWEMEDPIPEPDEEFKDVDGIGKYILNWFLHPLARAFGIQLDYNHDDLDMYTVKKQEYKDDRESDLYQKIFGKKE